MVQYSWVLNVAKRRSGLVFVRRQLTCYCYVHLQTVRMCVQRCAAAAQSVLHIVVYRTGLQYRPGVHHTDWHCSRRVLLLPALHDRLDLPQYLQKACPATSHERSTSPFLRGTSFVFSWFDFRSFRICLICCFTSSLSFVCFCRFLNFADLSEISSDVFLLFELLFTRWKFCFRVVEFSRSQLKEDSSWWCKIYQL